MTATSELGRYVQFVTSSTARKHDEHSPLSAVVARYSVVNNLLHLRDECAQHRANWVARTTAHRITKQPSAADTFEYMAQIGPFPGTLKPERVPYVFVFRLGGSIDDAAETATFRIVLSHIGRPLSSTADGHLAQADLTTSSTTDAILTPSSDLLTDTSGDLALLTMSTATSSLDAARVDSQHAMYRADVWVKCTNAGGGAIPTARLSGWLVREYVG